MGLPQERLGFEGGVNLPLASKIHTNRCIAKGHLRDRSVHPYGLWLCCIASVDLAVLDTASLLLLRLRTGLCYRASTFCLRASLRSL